MKSARFLPGVAFAALWFWAATFAATAEPVADTAASRLETVLAALQQATITLRSATGAVSGGFAEKGLDHLAPALAAAKAALDSARANPTAAGSAPPSPASPALDSALARLNSVRQAASGSRQRSLAGTLANLASALGVLQDVPGGDLGDARDKIISSVAQTTDDVVAGLEFADRNAPPPDPTPAPVAAIAAPTPAPSAADTQIATAINFVTNSGKLALNRYRLDLGDFPSTAQGLQALLTAPAGVHLVGGWFGPYLEGGAVPLDPWQHPYRYQNPGTHGSGLAYDLWSGGPANDGTTDIGNWMPTPPRPSLVDRQPANVPNPAFNANANSPFRPAAAPATAVTSLEAVVAGLEQANANLNQATVATHGGFVAQGQSHLAPAVAAANAALVFARSIPSLGAPPRPAQPAFDAALALLNSTTQAGHRSQPSMYGALAGLKAALVALQTVPGGEIGGKASEQIIAGIAQTARDVIDGIQFADANAAPGRGPRSGGASVAPVSAADVAWFFAPAPVSPGLPAQPASPLRFVAGPADAEAIIVPMLQDYYDHLGGPGAQPAALQSPQVSRPIESFGADLLAGGLETGTSSDRFHYIATAAGKPMADATIAHGKWASTAQFMANAIPQALGELVALDQVKAGKFEPRLLDFGGLWTVIWLKSVAGGADYFYPVIESRYPEDQIARQVPSLKAKTLYTTDEFLAAIRPELKAEADPNRPRGGQRGGG
jgi:general secretion pathway protein G